MKLEAAILLAAGSAASAQTLTPPNFFELGGNSWAYSPAYTQVVSGTGNVDGFRLVATAQPRTGTGAVWQSDLELTLSAPNGTMFVVGGTQSGWTPPASFISGTTPLNNGDLQFIDATYAYNLGPLDGTWSVNFYNTYSGGNLNWTDIQIIPLQFETGACCLPAGVCQQLTEAECNAQGGTYAGNNVDCSAIPPCPQPGACCFANGGCSLMQATTCGTMGGTFNGAGSDCATACPPPNDRLVPPNWSASANTWAYATDYTQNLSGGFNAQAFRLIVSAAPASGGAWQEDTQMRLESPNGVVLLIGRNTPILWSNSSHLLTGTRPGATASAQEIDATYLYDFGPVDGTWKVNFQNTWSSGNIEWGNIQIIPIELITGACCYPDGACNEVIEAQCTSGGGTYHGDNTLCATIPPCPQPGACCFSFSCQVLSETQCASTGGSYLGNGSACVGCPPPPPSFTLPVTHTEITGNGGYNTLLRTGAGNDRIHQVIWSESTLQAAGISPGTEITGLTYRGSSTSSGVNWPPVPTHFSNYEIRIGPAAVHPTAMSTSFASNFAGMPLLARTGPLDIPPELYVATTTIPPAGSPALPWGFEIVLQEPYAYTGGDLIVETRVTASTSTTISLYVDSLDEAASGAGANGYRTLAAAGLASTTGEFTFSSTPITLISGDSTSPCYANCDGSTQEPILNVDDFTCFINEFAAAQALPHSQQVEHYANCDGSTQAPALNVDDFTCFINEFAAGCR